MQFNEANPLAASSLGIAARLGDEKAVKKLLRSGRRVDVGDNRGWTPLHEAAAANNIICLHQLLLKGRRYVNQRTLEGETPLLLACKHQDSPGLISLLLNHGANVNLGSNENFTPLHLVCSNGKLQLAEILVEAGAKLDDRNYNSCTPLHFAVSSRNAELVNYLVNKGANINIQDECGRTALFVASETGNWDVVKPILTSDQCVVDKRALDGATALMIAAQYGNLEIVEELLQRGANPNLAADDDTMALHLAVHAGHVSIVELLLKVTSKEAVLGHCRDVNPMSSSLCGLAVDGESLDVLKLLLRSDLGNNILHSPVYVDVSIPQNHPNVELVYTKCSPVSFLLFTKMNELKEDILVYLNVLLEHGFAANVSEETCLPPLVAAAADPTHQHIMCKCTDILLAHGADLEYTTTNAGVPDALLAACIAGHAGGVFQLLHAGSSGLPDDLMKRLVTHNHLHPLTPSFINMVHLLLTLGITDLYVRKKLHGYFSEISDNDQIKDIVSLARVEVCSLQQLCRVAVRMYHGRSLMQAFQQTPIPRCIKNYLTYKTL